MAHLKKLFTDPSDPEEERLYKNLLESYHAFLGYKMTKIKSAFPEGLRYDDTWRFRYAYSFPIDEEASSRPDAEEKEVVKQPTTTSRRKLALLFHPDKCQETDARQLFEFVWEAGEEMISQITKSKDPIKTIREILSVEKNKKNEQNVITLTEKEVEIDTWTNGYPYMWFCNKETFVTEEEYLRKKAKNEASLKLETESRKLRCDTFELELKNLFLRYELRKNFSL